MVSIDANAPIRPDRAALGAGEDRLGKASLE
jgi:hypothetical protein